MADTKFTPGPWKLCAHLRSPQGDIDCSCGYSGGIWSGDGELLVCEMGTDKHHQGWEMTPVADRPTQLADAALIAAAPDLYEALEALEEHAKDRCANDEAWHPGEVLSIQVSIGDLRRAVSALAKARGETNG